MKATTALMCNFKPYAANSITACRILSSMVMLFCPVFSLRWYITYLLCGLTDIIDGPVARKTGSASDFGSKLDSAADLIFTATACSQLLPVLRIPVWIWAWIAVIAIIRITDLFSGLIQKKQLFPHTVLNKITGFLLFLLPLSLTFIDLKISSIIVCSSATLAAVQKKR